MVIDVLICEAHGLIRTGLRSTLDDEPDMQVVAEAADGREALEAARRLRPDVALLDASIPAVDSVEVTSRIVQSQGGGAPGTRVLLLGRPLWEEQVIEAARAGASGFLLTDGPPEDLVWAVRTVAAGGAVFGPPAAQIVLDHIARTAALPATLPERLRKLSCRELEVLVLLTNGLSNTEIAEALGRSEATVKSHISSLLAKLQMRDRLQAVVFAYQSGLVASEPRSLLSLHS